MYFIVFELNKEYFVSKQNNILFYIFQIMTKLFASNVLDNTILRLNRHISNNQYEIKIHNTLKFHL